MGSDAFTWPELASRWRKDAPRRRRRDSRCDSGGDASPRGQRTGGEQSPGGVGDVELRSQLTVSGKQNPNCGIALRCPAVASAYNEASAATLLSLFYAAPPRSVASYVVQFSAVLEKEGGSRSEPPRTPRVPRGHTSPQCGRVLYWYGPLVLSLLM